MLEHPSMEQYSIDEQSSISKNLSLADNQQEILLFTLIYIMGRKISPHSSPAPLLPEGIGCSDLQPQPGDSPDVAVNKAQLLAFYSQQARDVLDGNKGTDGDVFLSVFDDEGDW